MDYEKFLETKKTTIWVDLEELYNSLTDNEKFGLSFGLFPARLQSLNLSPEASAELIKMSQRENGIEF